jgi:uncharacterized protein YndB with AHSA1/START domain
MDRSRSKSKSGSARRDLRLRVDEQDFKVGGRSNYVMIDAAGAEYPAAGVFKEIVPIEKIVSSADGFSEEFRAAHPEMDSQKENDHDLSPLRRFG